MRRFLFLRPVVRRRGMLALIVSGAALFGLTGPALGADSSLKDDSRKAGRAAGGAVREVVQGVKKAGKEIGSAAKEGGKEFRRAVKGESR